MTNMHVHYSSQSDDWATPQIVFDHLNALFGPFTLDPCATPDNAKCSRFYTPDDDGLAQDWGQETVFMNPPYGRAISHWIRKAYRASLHGATVVCLIPARTDTRYWHTCVMRAREIHLIKGRICFGEGQHPAPFPSVVVVFRPPKEHGRRFVRSMYLPKGK